MLITNFAAGELAETLFGRTDLPQYYAGVSRLENFDVIPTGGISRRNGTKRLRKMEGEGRIIPFILDRDTHYLLFLTPGKIQVYLNGTMQSETVSSEAVPLYQDMNGINEVQYAQNYDKMVLVHENYAPVLLYLIDNTLYVSKFRISDTVEIKANPETVKYLYSENDKTYKDSGYLTRRNNYPRTVTFMNGRIVFGGTAENKQRLFFSSAADVHSFATYKLYLTEQKTYITITGSINSDETDTITLDATEEGLKFTEPLEDYYLATPFYPEGTKIVLLQGNILKVTDKALIRPPLSDTVKAELNELVNKFTSYNASTSQLKVVEYYIRQYVVSSYIDVKVEIYMTAHASELARHQTTGSASFSIGAVQLSDNAVELYEEDSLYYSDLVDNAVADCLRGSPYSPPMNVEYNQQNISTIKISLAAQSAATMKYVLPVGESEEIYYGKAPDIKQKIEIRYADAAHVYIPVYTKKIIEDRYPTPDDGFTFDIASDMSDAIKWIAQNKNLLVGTETAEWVVPAETTAVNIRAVLNSRYGSDRIQATSVGDALCFFQTGKKALVEYYIPQQDNNFRANNMTMLSKNMLHESPAFDFDFISAPYMKIFVSREDGTVVCLLYERGTGTFAWGRITTAGEIKSLATLPGRSGYDDVYMIVRRGDDFFLELLDEREKIYLDSNKAWNGDPAGYSAAAAVYDETDNKVYPVTQAPVAGHVMWIGYPYTSRVTSMPVIANNRMKPNIIKTLDIRFSDSFLPRVKSLPNSKEDTIIRQEPYSGVVQIPFPGVWDRDVFFEFIHDAPTRCRVLAVNAEAN
jgi:hypothetical protein